MKKRFVNVVIILIVLCTMFGSNVQQAKAAPSDSGQAAVITTGVISPASPRLDSVFGTRGAHLSGFSKHYFKTDAKVYLTNPDVSSTSGVLSSTDIVFNGEVVAPISGTIRVVRYCSTPTPHQIVFIQNPSGWAVGLSHILLNSNIDTEVVQGQPIGKTVLPPATSQGCGFGSGHHIHMTLMKWSSGSNGMTNFTLQPIVNTTMGQWIIKNTYLDGPRNDVQKGGKIEDIIKIISVHGNGTKIIEGRDTGVVRTMYFVAGNLKQTWNMIAAGDGYYYFKNRQYKNCMTIEGASTAIQAKVVLAVCGNNAHQKFARIKVPNTTGIVALQAMHSLKVLDIPTDWSIPKSGTGDGIQLQQYDPFYGTNQQWKFSSP